MKIMVAFLGNKKNSINKVCNTRKKSERVNTISREKFFSSLSNLDKLNNFERLYKRKNKTIKKVKKLNLNKINNKSTKETSKVMANKLKNIIYASVVSTENIILQNSKQKLDKAKVINNIEGILNNKQSSNLKFQTSKFDNNYKKYNFKLSKLINFMLAFIPLLVVLLINSTLANDVLFGFSTNFRQAENFSFEIGDLVKNYGLYNVNNYIINEDIQPKIEEAEKVKDVIITSDEEIIDKEAEIEDIAAFFENNKVNVQITENSSSIQRVTVGSMKILNYSSKRDIDYAGLLNSDVILTKKSDKILLYNTHTSETYTNSDGYKFGYTGTMRTTDANYNMLAIAKKFNENLKLKGFESVQDTTPHDYGTYTSAYAKSRITVKNALETMSGAGIIIDVHRDASSNLAYRPVANVKGVQVAQLMFVVGVGSSSTPNNNWQENLKLALKLQQMADKIYPGLFRPMIIRNSVYNQDLNKYALLIEFGATGNTIEEVKLATRCMTNLLNIMYKD